MEANVAITTEPDETKHYVCYFCEEEVAFLGPTQALLDAEKKYGKYHDYTEMKKPRWKHVESGEAACRTFATPSNLMIS